jgi:methylenetetrahydrofolate dehydrogenase (NADP+) / methenyltetrahydrofolate cyclohydrolase
MILDGKSVSKIIKEELKIEIDELISENIIPALAVIFVGNSDESLSYINMKRKMCESLNVKFLLYSFSESISETEIIECIESINNDNNIHGILIQLPLPSKYNKNKLIDLISYDKDIDGFHTMNAGRIFQNNDINIIPCTPQGCIDLIDYYGIDVEGMNITMIGTSNLVGLPLSMLLLQRGATITLCNIHTKDIKNHTIKSDMIITCCGVPKMVKNDWIKENVIIIDIGINYMEENGVKKMVGDVDYEDVQSKTSMITPVPGGIGPMTVISLIKNLLKLIKRN